MSYPIDFADYIESEEVRNYIKETGYELSTRQCVYIIQYSGLLTFAEKLALYEKLIESNKDEYVSEKIPSVLELLKAYLAVTQKFMIDFKSGGHFRAICDYTNELDEDVIEGEFNSFDELLERIFEKEKEIYKIKVTKDYYSVGVNGKGEITGFFGSCRDGASKRENVIFKNALYHARAPIPIPFKKGDLLETITGHAFVLAKDFDPSSGEVISVYTASCNNVRTDDFSYLINLCSLKTYKGELYDGEEILIPLSLYLKGKIKVDKLLAYFECLKMKSEIAYISRESGICDLDMLTGYDCSNYKGEPICDAHAEHEKNLIDGLCEGGDEECPF